MTGRGPSSGIAIGLLLPDVLGTYSDRGNATVLAQRLRWRGIPAEIVEVTADRPAPTSCDIYLLGGAEDAASLFAVGWLQHRPTLLGALRRGHVLAVCAGFQLLGRWTETPDGRRTPGLCLLDVTTTRGRRRAVGEAVVESALPGVGPVTGFENHHGRTHRGPGVAPLGRVRRGRGNGDDGSDGALTATVVATYLHGPVLARNPALADLVLSRVTGLDRLPPLDVADEEAARTAHLTSSAPGGRRRLLATVKESLSPR